MGGDALDEQRAASGRGTSPSGSAASAELGDPHARAALRAAARAALPPPSYEYSAAVVEEALAPELSALLAAAAVGGASASGGAASSSAKRSPPHAAVDDARPPELAPGRLQELFGQTVAYMYADADPGELSDFFSTLARRLGEALAAAVASRAAAEAAELQGCCALCERDMPLTLHHLIPREMHGRLRARKGLTPAQLSAGVLVCRPCHSAIHRAEDNKTLALEYNSLEALRAHPAIAKHAGWAARQRVAAAARGGGRALRHPR